MAKRGKRYLEALALTEVVLTGGSNRFVRKWLPPNSMKLLKLHLSWESIQLTSR